MTIRRRVGEGTVHPTVLKGRTVSWRGLASYKDPETGRQRRKSVSRPTRAEAQQALAALIRTLPKGSVKKPRSAPVKTLPEPTQPDSLHAFLVRWLGFKKPELRPSTYRKYVIALQPVQESLGMTDLGELRVLDIEDFIIRLHTERGTDTAGRSLGVLRMALRQAVRWDLLAKNPAQEVRKPKAVRREMGCWTPEQARAFLEAAAGHRLSPLFSLAISTGMRRGELLALQWGDVNLAGAEITIRHSLVMDETGNYVIGPPKTEASHRKLLLPADVVQLLRDLWAQEHRGKVPPASTAFVFASASGGYVEPRHLRRVYLRFMAQAGVPVIRFHDLRHTAASLLIRQGVSAKLVADRLGHTDAAFTLRVYTHVFDDQRAEAALPLAQLLASTPVRRPSMPQPTNGMAGLDLQVLHDLYAALGKVLGRGDSGG
ncbi:tyrosine-type recombinase/integrase [Deinococcus oregonensis]|uniref:Tyrosine-type recombinase/integrase n=1 Tax=Deinococcus oregonensis TaxID=1805970 RepID=A0ABV6AYS7_9DEIO